tara:strand:- start:3253 stop:3573 length:321 start_codon:yes stop_codon:yes gene_type:complete
MGDWPAGLLREELDAVILAVAVQPGSKRISIEGIDVWRGRLQIAVKAIPQKGAANEAVCELLSETFGIPLVFVDIIAGHRSRQKSVKLRQVSRSDIELHLEGFRVE